MMSNLATLQRLNAVKGDHLDVSITINDSDGEAVDITGSSVIMTVRSSSKPSEVTFSRKNTAAGGSDSEIEMTSPTTGVFIIHIIPSNTADLSSGSYNFDVEITFVSGKRKTPIIGLLILSEDYTKH